MCSERQWKSREGLQPFLASPFPKFHLRLLLGGKKGSIVEMWTVESRFNKIPVWKEQEKTMLSHRPWQWRGDNQCGPKFDPEIFVARTVRAKCRPQTAADHCFHHANDGEKRIVPLLSNPENNGLQSAFCTVQLLEIKGLKPWEWPTCNWYPEKKTTTTTLRDNSKDQMP